MSRTPAHRASRVLSTIAAAAGAAIAAPAFAQIAPDKMYYGFDRAIPMTVSVPASMNADAATIALLAPETAEVVHSAPVAAGRVDLAALFPTLWSDPLPKLVYAQLMVGQEKVGPAVVLSPMLSPPLAVLLDPQAPFRWRSMGDTYSGIRAWVDQDIKFETTHGDVRVRLRPDHAPNTCLEIMNLVEGGYYEDVMFHRIVPFVGAARHPFVVQFGDPTGMGTGGPGGYFDLEQSRLPHDFGVLSMARSSDPNSNGSQMFLCLSRPGTAILDGQYTAFGQTIEGAETIRAISAVPIDGQDRPVGDPPKVIRASLVDAAPYGTGPAPVSTAAAPPQER